MNVIHKEDGTVEVSHRVGFWRVYASPLDAVCGECKLLLGIEARKGAMLDLVHRQETGISMQNMSKLRTGRIKFPPQWILRFHVWSGMPIKDLEALTQVMSPTHPHHSIREQK